MAHRGTGHAARRRLSVWRGPEAAATLTERGYNGVIVSSDWDATTYDDVVPHRLRGALRLDEDGEPAELTDLVANHRLA